MTKSLNLALIAAFVGGPALAYAAFSFAIWDCNPYSWGGFWRTVYLFVAFGGGSAAFFALKPYQPKPSRWLQ